MYSLSKAIFSLSALYVFLTFSATAENIEFQKNYLACSETCLGGTCQVTKNNVYECR